MNPDGISYVDIGDAFFHGNWTAVLNPYWSPLYPVALGAARRIFSVPLKWEYPLIHAVNFAIFVFLIIPCFEFFWGTVFGSDLSPGQQLPCFDASWWVVGYALLAVTMHMQQALAVVTPDLMVTGLLLLAAGILVRVGSETSRARDFLLLGAVLGVGYLAKAPMFPVAFFFFVAAFARRRLDSRQLLRLCLMILSFALVSVPLVFLLSRHNRGFTFGESGKLNLAWHIDGVAPWYEFWEGGPPGSGMPVHPPRQIWRSPDVYEFATPISATYPLWRDPRYWHEGVRAHADAHGMARASLQNLRIYLKFFGEEYYVPFVTVLLFLTALRRDYLAVFRHLLTHWPLLLVAVCALVMYGVILVDPRFVAGFLFLLWPPLFLATGAFTSNTNRVARAAAFSLAIMVLPMLRRGLIEERHQDTEQNNINTAIAVQQSGVNPGDKVAYIGDAIEAVWAKLDQVSIVVEAPSHYWSADGHFRAVEKPFWQSLESEQAAIYDALGKTDIKAILATTPSTGVPGGWQQVGHTNLCVKFLR